MSGDLIRRLRPRRTGCGIAIRGANLVVVVARVGGDGVEVVGRTELRSFRERPPAEWGAEYSTFLESIGQSHLRANLAVPRSEVELRLLSFPPMSRSDLAKAIEIQLHDLHPYGEAPIYKSFAVINGVTSSPQQHVVVAVTEAHRINGYTGQFAEANIDLAGCTVSAEALKAATTHQADSRHSPFLLADQHGSTLEVYGVSEGIPLLSSSLHIDGVSADGALRLAREGLGVRSDRTVSLAFTGAGNEDSAPSGTEVVPVENLVAAPSRQVGGFDLKRDAIAMGAAILSAEGGRGRGLNLLPPAARKRMSVAPLVPRLALAGALGVVTVLLAILPTIQDWRYAKRLRHETATLEATAAALAREVSDIAILQERYRWLLERRERTRSDLDLLREISEILPDSAWLTALRIEKDSAVLTGMAAEADPLLSLLSSSPSAGQARFVRSPTQRERAEQFQIEVQRR